MKAFSSGGHFSGAVDAAARSDVASRLKTGVTCGIPRVKGVSKSGNVAEERWPATGRRAKGTQEKGTALSEGAVTLATLIPWGRVLATLP